MPQLRNFLNQFRTRRELQDSTPTMSPVSVALSFWVVISGLVAVGIYTVLINSPDLIGPNDSGLDVVQIVLTIMAGLGAVFLGVYAYRRQQLQEVASVRDDHAQFLARYNAATAQLADDKAAARLAGVYAMARLADDWPAQRQQCVDVLCAYLRMPPGTDEGDLEVRATLVRVITDHLRKTNPGVSWSGLAFNFDRAQFHDLDMSDVVFNGHKVTFQGAEFFGKTSFSGATFHTELRFNQATFSGTALEFDSVTFKGPAQWFFHATFDTRWTSFQAANFAGNFTDFTHTTFNSPMMTFRYSTFEASFTSFDEAIFNGDPDFFNTVFHSQSVTFDEAEFNSDHATFDEVTFRGKICSFKEVMLQSCHMRFDKMEADESMVFVGFDKVSLDKGSKITKDGQPFNGWNHESK